MLLDPAAGDERLLAGGFQRHDHAVEPRFAAGDQKPDRRHAAAGAARLLQGLDQVEENVAGEDRRPHEQQRLPRGEQGLLDGVAGTTGEAEEVFPVATLREIVGGHDEVPRDVVLGGERQYRGEQLRLDVDHREDVVCRTRLSVTTVQLESDRLVDVAAGIANPGGPTKVRGIAPDGQWPGGVRGNRGHRHGDNRPRDRPGFF